MTSVLGYKFACIYCGTASKRIYPWRDDGLASAYGTCLSKGDKLVEFSIILFCLASSSASVNVRILLKRIVDWLASSNAMLRSEQCLIR